jgi:hypothetical protein
LGEGSTINGADETVYAQRIGVEWGELSTARITELTEGLAQSYTDFVDTNTNCGSTPITDNGVSYPASEGTEVILSIAVNADATAPVQYQWFEDGVAMDGEVGPTLTITLTTDNQFTAYTVLVINPCSNQISAAYVTGEVTTVVTVETLLEDGITHSAYGQDQILSQGITTTGKWMVNQRGTGDILMTTDDGATFQTFNIQPSTGSRIIQRMELTSAGVWYVNQYRSDQREHRLWWSYDPVTIPTGGWNFTSVGAFSYTHGDVVSVTDGPFAGHIVWGVDGQNNSNNQLTTTTDHFPITANRTYTYGAPHSGTGSTSQWHHYRHNGQIWVTYGGQGTPSVNYEIYDEDTLAPLTKHTDVLYDGRTSAMSSSGNIKSTGRLNYGGAGGAGGVVGSTVKVQNWGYLGMQTEDTITFPSDVDYPCMHFAGGRWFCSAFPLNDPNKMYIARGATGSNVIAVDLPHPWSAYPFRALRQVQNGFIMGYLATIGATGNCVVVLRLNGL